MESKSYPFYDYLIEDKSQYKHAKDCGYNDPDDLFLIGESGGFLLNIQPGVRFINTDEFRPMALYYKKNKNYTNFKVDSIPHRQLRKREQYRRDKGYTAPCLLLPDGTVKNIRITGEHYNFLNYNRIELLDVDSVIKGNSNTAKKKYDFPRFIDAQFWFFHIREFAKANGFHLIIDKTRRGGFSYNMASASANGVNNKSRKVVIHVAADKKYLTTTGGLTDFAVNNLKFYEENTPFKRGVLSTVKHDFRLGYKLPNGIEADKSWRSALIAVSANNNPDCAIGKDAMEVDVEEVSTMENFDEFMNVTEPAMRTGAYTTGFLCAWGTATAGNMQTFELNFYNPKAFNFMPFENVWDRDSREQVCGYFKSYAWGLEGEVDGHYSIDRDGNSNVLVGLQIAKHEREIKKANAKTYADYINYLGQYALFPAESFSSATENIFSSEELTAWEEKLRIDDDLHFGVDGMFEDVGNGEVKFKTNAQLREEGKKVYDWINGVPRRSNEDPHGCVRIWFFPEYRDVSTGYTTKKVIPQGAYSIVYDPVGVDKNKDEITNKHSHNCIQVYMNPSPYNGFRQKLCAEYYGRPDKLEEADKICLQLAIYYGCIGTVQVEINRGETVSNFRKWNALRFLAFEPVFVWDTSVAEKYAKTYGFNMGSPQKKLEGIRLLKEFLYEVIGKDENDNPIRNFHRIYDYQTILELKKWNDKGNFDRVSAMILRGVEWKAYNLNAQDELNGRVELTAENLDENDILNRDWYSE